MSSLGLEIRPLLSDHQRHESTTVSVKISLFQCWLCQRPALYAASL